MNLPKDDLLKGAENREELSRILDQADQAFRTWDIVQTDFLSPPSGGIDRQPVLC